MFAVITGASGGIGAAVARRLAPTHSLLLGGRDAAVLASLAAELDAPHGVRTVIVDITDPAAVTDALTGIERVDALVHAAGTVALGTVAATEPDVWRAQLEVNLLGTVHVTRALLGPLRAAGGHVVVVNSGAGRTAKPGWGAYAASKFAVRAFADALRAEEPELRVTSVYPGRVDTAMQRRVVAAEGGEYRASSYLPADAVAAAIEGALRAGSDAHPTEIIVRPRESDRAPGQPYGPRHPRPGTHH